MEPAPQERRMGEPGTCTFTLCFRRFVMKMHHDVYTMFTCLHVCSPPSAEHS